MAARRCSVDGVSYPDNFRHETCPICGERTHYISNATPDEDWEWKVERALAAQAQAEALTEPIPRLTKPVKFIEENGQVFVAQSDLIRAGLRKGIDQSFWVFTDHEGRLWEAQGWDEPRRRWWVEELALREEEIPRDVE
jgi:hypothetical protein